MFIKGVGVGIGVDVGTGVGVIKFIHRLSMYTPRPAPAAPIMLIPTSTLATPEIYGASTVNCGFQPPTDLSKATDRPAPGTWLLAASQKFTYADIDTNAGSRSCCT